NVPSALKVNVNIVAAPASEPLKIMPAFGFVAPVPLVAGWGSVSVRIHFTWVPTGTMVWLLLLLAGSWNAQQKALTMCGLCAAAGRMHAARTRETENALVNELMKNRLRWPRRNRGNSFWPTSTAEIK